MDTRNYLIITNSLLVASIGGLLLNTVFFCRDHDNCSRGIPERSRLGSSSNRMTANVEIGLSSFLAVLIPLSLILQNQLGGKYSVPQIYWSFILAVSILLCVMIDKKSSPKAHFFFSLSVLVSMAALITQNVVYVGGVLLTAFLFVIGNDLGKQVLWGVLIWLPLFALLKSNAEAAQITATAHNAVKG